MDTEEEGTVEKRMERVWIKDGKGKRCSLFIQSNTTLWC